MNEAETFKAALLREKPTDELEQAFRQGYLAGRSDSRLERIAYHYGYDAQREQFIEECAEAILAAQKCKRHGSKDNFEALCGEVADVLIMARQMRLLIGSKLVDSIIEEKLNRQLERISKGE